jgi:MFS transporter, DHA3 family, macrolide efflux protein
LTSRIKAPSGMKAYIVIAIGQFVSMLATGMTGFGIGIWAWQQTGQATPLALAGFFFMAPLMLLSPLAGAIVDRSNRKTVMILSDLAAGLMTIILLVLLSMDRLQIWHIYVTNAFTGAFQAFQFPAFSAATTTMISKEQYGRANGIRSMAEAASGILAPAAAAAAIGFIGLRGIMAIDIVTFLVAIGTILLVHIPQPEETAAGREGRGSLLKESGYGFKYIFARPSLLGLQLVFFGINLFATLSNSLFTPMILARTDSNEIILGSVRSVAGIGMLAGGLLLSTWGGPKRRVHGVLGGMLFSSILAYVLMGFGRGPIVWGIASFFGLFFIPIINGSNQAIWQAKVAPDVQGRVFSVRLLIAQVTAPIAMLITGPLADKVFEPAMSSDGALAVLFGPLVGIGPGAGMALMFIITGLLGAGVAVAGYLVPVVRNAEDLLPDHDQAPSVEEPVAEPSAAG